MKESTLNILFILIIVILSLVIIFKSDRESFKVLQLKKKVEEYKLLNEEYQEQLDGLLVEKQRLDTLKLRYFKTIDSLNSEIDSTILRHNESRDIKTTEILSVVNWNYFKRDSFWAKEFNRRDTLLLPKKIRL